MSGRWRKEDGLTSRIEKAAEESMGRGEWKEGILKSGIQTAGEARMKRGVGSGRGD